MLEISLVVFGNLTIVSKKNTNADIVKIYATSVLMTAKCWLWVRFEILELKVRRSQKKRLEPSILPKKNAKFLPLPLKVSKFRKPIFLFSFEPKDE